MLAIFVLFYGPWMVRNYQVCGNPVGLGWYSGLYQRARHGERKSCARWS